MILVSVIRGMGPMPITLMGNLGKAVAFLKMCLDVKRSIDLTFL